MLSELLDEVRCIAESGHEASLEMRLSHGTSNASTIIDQLSFALDLLVRYMEDDECGV